MRIEFTNYEIENEFNKVYIEEDDAIIVGEFLEGEGKCFTLKGSYIIDGETYRDFEVKITLEKEIKEPTASDIINSEWEYYEYVF